MHVNQLMSAFVMATLCSANPIAQGKMYQPMVVDSLGISQGLPAEYLPPQEFADSNSVKMPINPALHPDLQVSVQWSYEDGPKGGLQLATSIFLELYYAWKDITNQPLTKAVSQRQNPFSQFEFRIQPSLQPGTALTPVKCGVTYCQILYQLLSLQRWPGHAQANILQTNRLIGSINIDNSPLVLDTATASTGTDDHSDDGLSATPFENQQRWLRCFYKAVQSALVHFPSDLVTNSPAFPPQHDVHRYPFSCGSAGLADRVDMFIYPDANAGSPLQLTWQKLMTELLLWIINVAKDRDAGKSMKVIQDRRLIAEVSIYLQPI